MRKLQPRRRYAIETEAIAIQKAEAKKLLLPKYYADFGLDPQNPGSCEELLIQLVMQIEGVPAKPRKAGVAGRPKTRTSTDHQMLIELHEQGIKILRRASTKASIAGALRAAMLANLEGTRLSLDKKSRMVEELVRTFGRRLPEARAALGEGARKLKR
jgi:hypothetical protein